MKIYSKSNFALGLGLTVVGLALLGVDLWKGVSWKGLCLSGLCLFFGVGVILRSLSRTMSREDALQSRDERNQLVKLRSRGTSFLWAEGICFLFLLGSIVVRPVLGPPAAGMVTAFGVMLGAMFALELVTLLYYQRKL